MSGPKTSNYTLTIEQMRILQEQIERERRIQEEVTKIKRYAIELRKISDDFTEPLEQAKELQRRTNEGKEYISEVEGLCEDIENKIEANFVISKEIGLEKLEIHRKILESCIRETKSKVVKLSEKTNQLKETLVEDIRKGVDQGFLFEMPVTIGNRISEESSNISEEMLKKLREMAENCILQQSMQNDIVNAINKIDEITDLGFLQNYKAMTYSEIVKQYNKYINDYANGKNKYDTLIIRYCSLCEMIEVPVKEYVFSIETIEELETQNKLMEKQLVKQREESYISSCMDVVMTEMGYDLLGEREVIKRSGKHFRNELYSFNEGTAVNVTYASDGKITMELGGMDKKDRLPSGDELNRLCDDMNSFCNDFTKIENKLKEKGIIVGKRISILPPAPEYAQVINISDYNIKAEDKLKATQVKKRKLSTGNKKTFNVE